MNWPANCIDAGAAPRASLIHLPHRADLTTAIWMGGSDSLLGEPIALDQLDDAIVVDCAGDLAAPFRDSARRYVPRVFMDAEVVPYAFTRLAELVDELAQAIVTAPAAGSAAPPARVYILCQYGMNRSGLLTALLLCALGEQPAATIARIRRHRPGALSNQTFTRLIAERGCRNRT